MKMEYILLSCEKVFFFFKLRMQNNSTWCRKEKQVQVTKMLLIFSTLFIDISISQKLKGDKVSQMVKSLNNNKKLNKKMHKCFKNRPVA